MYNINIPDHIQKLAVGLFGQINTTQAVKFITLSKVTLSFTKGSPETYFIVSGLVRDNKSHESKVVYKKRLEGTEEGPIKSNCDCHLWSVSKHCPHTTALYILYMIKNEQKDEHIQIEDDKPPLPSFAGLGVTVEEYGTIINAPHKLIGANATSTYSSLQYLLHTKKTINFPIPTNTLCKIGLNYIKHFKTDDSFEKNTIKFFLIDEEDKKNKHINLFENLYLFDWQKGHAYHLAPGMKEFVQKIRYSGPHILELDEIIKLSELYSLRDNLELFVNDHKISELKKITPSLRVTIDSAETRNLIEFNLNFVDEHDNTYPIPNIIKAFTFNVGLLNSFKKKKDAYEFVTSLVDFFDEEQSDFKKLLHNCTQKKEWISLIDYLIQEESTYCYNEYLNSLVVYENKFLILLISSCYKFFGELFFRFSSYNEDSQKVSFQISFSNLLSGLSGFYTKMFPYGVEVLYNNDKIKTWSGKIRFERGRSDLNWFDVNLEIDDKDLEILKKVDLENNISLSKHGLTLFTPEQKTFAKLIQKYTKYVGKEVESNEKGVKKFTLPFNRASIFELFELKKLGIDGILTQEEEEICEKLLSFEGIPEYPLPQNLENVLRPYQVTGFRWLKFLYEYNLGACLADDMGLGKTLQTISFLISIYENVDKVLIVCPVSILFNWENEFKKFSNINALIYHGGDREIDHDKKIILTSYGIMKKEAESVFSKINFDVIILDEVQHLKNIRSMGAFAVRQLKSKFRICLTGTPVENDLAEFYNILDLSIPGIWGDLKLIRSSSNKQGRLSARKTARPFILRRTKAQVLSELPPKIENTVHLSFSEQENTYYQNKMISIRKKIETSPKNKKYGEILKGILELRQACLWDKEDPMKSTKIEFLIETLEQILEEGHQAIIFSQFTTYLDYMQTAINKKSWTYARIDGSQSVNKRHEQVKKFQEGKCPIFLISLKAGGVGLNLTAASYVFIMDPWWNPAVENQAIDRAHRIGQLNTLTVYRPIIEHSVEEKVLKLQELKRELFKDLLPDEEEELFTGKLSMKDFEDLLN
ncbi:MAG: DEAD/DEAH box helicase [Halobacteriovoraceae bacterium]|nr:DEAD/DEAH box helicase [Halobacteriovoraceae bacterium]